jgi:hypothetical protein
MPFDLRQLWITEWVVCGFFFYLIVLSHVRRLSLARRRRVLLVGLVCIALALMLSQLQPSPALRIVRDWVPAVYLLQGYWMCGLFFRRPALGIERRLLAFDTWLFERSGLRRAAARAPRLVASWFEATYLLAYPFVPVGFGVLLALGHRDRADEFWLAALIAGFTCYGTLPWIQTRPPRALAGDRPLWMPHLVLRSLNATVLRRMSVQVNTCPSGHAATSVAVALTIVAAGGGIVVGAGFLLVAASIVAATVLARYHYALDTLLGLAVGVLAWGIAYMSL